MDPSNVQFSIDDPFSDNAVVYPGYTLPRSFTLADHGSVSHGAFAVLSIALSPGQSFTRPHHGKQACGVSSNLSNNHSRTFNLGLFSSASVGGNSCALFLAIIRKNQTRILFLLDSVRAFFGGLIAVRLILGELDVPYTVIRAQSVLSATSVPTSDYLKDLYSFCFAEKGAPCCRFMGEFSSRTAHLNTVLDKEKNKEG